MTTFDVGVAFRGAGFVRARPHTLAHRAARDGGVYSVELWPKRLSDALDTLWDFTEAVDDDWTFARASAGSYWAAPGSPAETVLVTAGSGAARHELDPLTALPRGLLMEPARTNLLLRSAAFDDASWTKIAGMTVSANAATAPDGTAAADLVVAGGSTFGGVLRQSITKSQNTIYTLSVFAKMASHRYLGFRLPDNVAASADGNTYTTFDLVDGSVVASPDIYVTTRAEQLSNGWWRLSVAGTLPAAAVNDFCDFALVENANGNINYAPSGSPTPTVYLWGAQVEAGRFPSSYIATAGAGATRAADLLDLDDASAWSGAEGSAMLEAAFAGRETGFVGLFSFDDASVSERVEIAHDGSQLLPAVAHGGVTLQPGYGDVAVGTVFRLAMAWSVGRLAASRDGDPAGLATAVLEAPAPTRVTLGRLYDDSGAAALWLRRLYAVNRTLSDADLAYLSSNGRPRARTPSYDAGGGLHRIPIAEKRFASLAADDAGARPFDPTLADDGFAMTRSLLDGDDVGGLARIDVSSIEAVNAAGDFDQITRDFAPDGRRWRVKVGRDGRGHDAHATVMEGAIERWAIDEDRFTVTPRDWLALLDVAFQTQRFAGTGGLEGGEDLADRPKPVGLGPCRNVECPLVDPVNLVWMLNAGPPGDGGAIRNVTVYDNGAAFSSANVEVRETQGTVRLLTAPAGSVKFDFDGGIARAGSPTETEWPASVADLVRIALVDFVGLDEALIDDLSFAQAAATAGGRAHLVVGADEALARDVVAELVAGMTGWLAPDRQRRLRLGVVTPPGSILTAPHRLTEAEIETLQPIDPPAALFPPARRVRVGWRRNHAPQSDGLAGIVSTDPARVEFLKTEYRITAEDTTAAADHALARDPPPVPSLVDELAHAEILRSLRRGIVAPAGPGRLQRVFRLTARGLAHDIEPMDDVAVWHSRFNLVGGAVFKAVEIAERIGDGVTELVLLR